MHSHEHDAKLAYCDVINKIKCNFLFVFYIILHCFVLLRHTVYRHKVRLRAVFGVIVFSILTIFVKNRGFLLTLCLIS